MKIGFLFPGQGSQSVGMGKDIFEEYEEAQAIYKKVEELTNIDIAKIAFEGPEEELNRTKYTQMAILANSLAILEILKTNNIQSEISAGLSLGEYTALINSGAIKLEEGIKLVQKRGEYMEDLTPKGKWKMAAILGLSDEQVEQVCKEVSNGFVVVANYNCKGQIVISGEEEAIQQAEAIAKEKGAKKVKVLNTAGPFHTKMLQRASDALKKELENVTIHKFNSNVIKNIDGCKYTQDDDVKEILASHIINPVMFSKTIETMLEEGIDTFIEIGPGKTLSGFVKRTETEKAINILNINDIKSLHEVLKFVKEGDKSE